MYWKPKEDGVTHINVYSRGATQLGRWLTNFSHHPFTYGPYGRFSSVEGFWYYYLTGCKCEQFRSLYGYRAKKEGQKYRGERIDKSGLSDQDKEVLLEAIRCKLRQNRDVLKALTESTLPLAHYYYYGDKENPKVYYLEQYDWIIQELERIRRLMKERA